MQIYIQGQKNTVSSTHTDFITLKCLLLLFGQPLLQVKTLFCITKTKTTYGRLDIVKRQVATGPNLNIWAVQILFNIHLIFRVLD